MFHLRELIRLLTYTNKVKQEAYEAEQRTKQDEARNRAIAEFHSSKPTE